MLRDDEQGDQLLRLWVRNQHEVFRYIFALLPHSADANEVLQATCVALWRKSVELDLNRPFLPLAFRFAVLEVRKHREKNRRWGELVSESLLETVAQERQQTADLFELRRQALEGCLASLEPADRDLVERHYRKRMTMPEIAEATGRNIHTLYKSIQRIRRQLMLCINGAVSAEGDV